MTNADDPATGRISPAAAHRPWDQLSESPAVILDTPDPESDSGPDPVGCGPSRWVRMASGWADLVVVGIMTTAILAAVLVVGYPVHIDALPWAAGVALLWWVLCSVLCLRIRRGSPGMLVAGVVFAREVGGSRIAWTVITAAISAALIGLPALPGGRERSLLSLASGSHLETL